MNIKSIFKNKIYIYVVTRYLTYALQFVISLIIAVRLSPYYLGVYGLVQLVLNYFKQVNLGIPNSLNVFLIQNKNNKSIFNNYVLNSVIIYIFFSILIIVIGFIIYFLDLDFEKGDILYNYLPYILFIAIIVYFEAVFLTVIRVRNEVHTMSLVGTIPVIFNFIAACVFKEERLLLALIIAQVLSGITVLILYYNRGAFPRMNTKAICYNTQKSILHKGLFLFLYNSCFYFILISIRTIVSANYSIVEYGFFTFAFTMANAVMLLLDAFQTIIFPKTIDLLSNRDVDKIMPILQKMREGYLTMAHLLIYSAILFFPILVWIIPQYSPSLVSMNFIALAILMETNSFGYTALLIAHNKERICAVISLLSLCINIVLGFALVHLMCVDFSYVIVATLVTYICFSFFSVLFGYKEITNTMDVGYALKSFFPLRLLVPYCLSLFFSFWDSGLLMIFPLLAFGVLNQRQMSFLKRIMYKLTKTPEVIDV